MTRIRTISRRPPAEHRPRLETDLSSQYSVFQPMSGFDHLTRDASHVTVVTERVCFSESRIVEFLVSLHLLTEHRHHGFSARSEGNDLKELQNSIRAKDLQSSGRSTTKSDSFASTNRSPHPTTMKQSASSIEETGTPRTVPMPNSSRAPCTRRPP